MDGSRYMPTPQVFLGTGASLITSNFALQISPLKWRTVVRCTRV